MSLQWNTWSKDQGEHDHKRSDYNKDEVAAGFQNFLICIEMFFAALAHAYAFPPKDYFDPSWTVKSGFVYSLRVMFNVRDVVDDVEDVVQDTVGAKALVILQGGMPLTAAVNLFVASCWQRPHMCSPC